MSYLDQFLKETNSSSQQNQALHYENMALLHQGGSIESEEGDIEDNRALSISSSKSNLSESSLVSYYIQYSIQCTSFSIQLQYIFRI